MQNAQMELVERSSMKQTLPEFEIGDTVDVHVRILEGDKERIQIFNGVVIARSGAGTREMLSVRRIVQGEGVEAQVSDPFAAHCRHRRQAFGPGSPRQALLPPRAVRQGRPFERAIPIGEIGGREQGGEGRAKGRENRRQESQGNCGSRRDDQLSSPAQSPPG